MKIVRGREARKEPECMGASCGLEARGDGSNPGGFEPPVRALRGGDCSSRARLTKTGARKGPLELPRGDLQHALLDDAEFPWAVDFTFAPVSGMMRLFIDHGNAEVAT